VQGMHYGLFSAVPGPFATSVWVKADPCTRFNSNPSRFVLLAVLTAEGFGSDALFFPLFLWLSSRFFSLWLFLVMQVGFPPSSEI